MNTKRLVYIIVAVAVMGFLVSCDMINDFMLSRTRPLTLIQTYNSNLEQTRRLVPNDTLYVQVQGLQPGELYTVQCVDPAGDVITEIISIADDEGNIATSPLWYNIGFVKDENGRLQFPESDADLFLRAFNIRVSSIEEDHTDFKLPFFFISDDEIDERPQPILISGKSLDNEFYLSNAFYASDDQDPSEYGDQDDPLTDIVYINTENLHPLIENTDNPESIIRLWVLNFTGEHFQDGDPVVGDALFYKDYFIDDLRDIDFDPDDPEKIRPKNVLLEWPEDEPTIGDPVDLADVDTDTRELIPKWAEGKAFSLHLDMMHEGPDNAGFYNVKLTDNHYLDAIDGNGIAAFLVKYPDLVDDADYTPMNLASGGMFGYPYSIYNEAAEKYEYNYDYRNTFRDDGVGTKESYWYNVPKGIKVIWNPYFSRSGWQGTGKERDSNFYWGRMVDVYIVESTQPLTEGAEIISAPGTTKRRVPIQYSCGNGLSQQTIWPAPMIPGHYMAIVDMTPDPDFNVPGKINEYTLVDNLKQDWTTWELDGDKGYAGFEVIEAR